MRFVCPTPPATPAANPDAPVKLWVDTTPAGNVKLMAQREGGAKVPVMVFRKDGTFRRIAHSDAELRALGFRCDGDGGLAEA